MGRMVLAAMILIMAGCSGATAQIPPQQAQSPCKPRLEWLKALSHQYHETVVEVGITPSGTHILELLVSPEGETWSIIVSKADGSESCMLAAGTGWVVLPSGSPL